ncbi:MAG: ABC transporter permease subunit [Pirellulales bacterium]|nr:ABC transporter permease subunit [Pirellulales bacterium]
MRLPLGPVFSIELITAARRTRYFVLRSLYAAVLLLAFWIVYESSARFSGPIVDMGSIANLTAEYFKSFSFLQILVILLIGPAMVAGTIASERERRTIEYLFAADLGNAEIVLNKLAARLMQILVLLLTGLPILSIAMLLGGIAPEALFVVYTITGSTVVMVGALGIAISVWSRRVREAVTKVYLVLLALLLVPWVIYMVVMAWAFSTPTGPSGVLLSLNTQFLIADPFYTLSNTLSDASGTNPAGAWDLTLQLVRNQMILSGVLIAAAVFGVRRVHLKQMGKGSVKRRRRWHLQLWRPAIGDRPMLWKELFAESAAVRLGLLGSIVTCLLVACVLVVAGMLVYSATTSPSGFGRDIPQGLLVGLAVAVSCGMLLMIVARSAGCITSEKERDTWDSLMTTPLTGGEIIAAKVFGNIWAVKGWFGLLVVVWVLATMLREGFLFGAIGTMFVLMMLAFYASSLGVVFSLYAKSSLRAMGAALGVIIFFGGAYLFCCIPVFLAGAGHGGGEQMSMAGLIPFLLAMPGAICMDGNPPSEVMAAFVIGLIGYSIAGLVLYGLAVDRLENGAGRPLSGTAGYPSPLHRPIDVQPLSNPLPPGEGGEN